MKKLLLLIIIMISCCFSPTYSTTTSPIGYIEFFNCEKWNSIDTNDCNINIYYKINAGRIDIVVKSNNLTVKGDYKIYLFDMFGRKIIENNIENPISFYKDNLKQGLYYLKITNNKEVFNKVLEIN